MIREEGDSVKEQKAMHEIIFLKSWLRDDESESSRDCFSSYCSYSYFACGHGV